jgi:putative FmdB family regulatory protein
MPVYEFYCDVCHTIFNFLSRRPAVDKRPPCPRCGKSELERQVSCFALSRGRTDEGEDGVANLDEAALEKAMATLAGEMQGIDENDPRQMARFMRRMAETTGMNLGQEMEEAMRRLEKGEDPEMIEEEMGELFADETLFTGKGITSLKRRLVPPAHDETLYPL